MILNVVDGELGILASAIRRWAAGVLPGDDAAADRAVQAALAAATEGESMSWSCEVARHVIYAWAAHPSRPRAAERLLPEAS